MNRLKSAFVRMTLFRRTKPVSRKFGFDRGTPIDRYYIESFLSAHSADIRGRVLEIGDASYTHKYGGENVRRSEVLHAASGNANATIQGDLATGENIPIDAYDCIILTQTLHCIYDVQNAVSNARRALQEGGVLIATVPGISQISRYDADRWGDHWRLTTDSAGRMFEQEFGAGNVSINVYGNVLAAASFLYGLASEELTEDELNVRDPDYEVLIAIRAVKNPSGVR